MHAYLDLLAFAQAAHADHPDTTFYCLADHAGMPGLLRELGQAGIGWRSLFAGSREEAALSVAPLLFAIDDALRLARHDFLRWVAEHGTYTSSMLLLASPLGLDELAARLARRLDARLLDEIDVLLRFFDPRTFAALAATLDARKRAAFLGVADGWWYLDHAGQVVAVPAQFQAEDAFDPPLCLDAAQQAALLVASEPDQVAMRLDGLVPAMFEALPLPRRHAFIVEQMTAARALGLASVHDLTLYCVMVLYEDERFAQRPEWQAAFDDIRAGKIGFGDAMRRVES